MRRNVLTILLAITLAVPVAAANWSYRGANEPDTAYDTPEFMFFEPDTDSSQSVHKIYFNAFGRAARIGHYNANVAMIGSTMQPPLTTTSAILGYWKDCNNDGYIGQIETAVLEYRAELLLDDSICPSTTPTKTQTVYPHNDGTWVREFIWIGPRADAVGSTNDNPTNFYADGTAIWGDWGLPGDPPLLVCQGGANAGLRSTGAIIDVVDCNTYFATVRTLNTVQSDTGLPVGGWQMQDIDNSPSPLNVDNPAYYYLYGPADAGPTGADDPNYEGDYRGWGGGLLARDSDEQRRERMVTLVDCENDEVEPSTEVNTPGDVTDPRTYPSLYESLNDTYEVAQQSPSGGDGGNVCDPSAPGDEGLGYNLVHPEGYNEHTFAAQGRREVDHQFKFSPGSRNTLPAGDGNCRINGNNDYSPGELGYCVPADLGLAVERDDLAVGPGWRTNAQIVTYTISTRDQALHPDNAEPDFGGWYMTFYARIGQAAFDVGISPTTQSRIYGAEACGDNDSGIHNYWSCNEADWFRRCVETGTTTLPEHCYRVGFNYHLRDVDCWDNSVARGSGIRLGLSDVLSQSGPCALNDANSGMDLPVG